MAGLDLLILCGPEANQRALAHKLVSDRPNTGIVVVDISPRLGPRRSLKRIARGVAGLPLRRAWFGMLSRYQVSYPAFPSVPLLTVDDANHPAVMDLVRQTAPRLTIVSGTNLLKRPVIDAIRLHGPVMNLHTGISPFVKGAPNCTNWCLAIGQFELIGNTVMWIDPGIDSGNLITTEQTPLTGRESLTGLHVKVMEHAHDLLGRCVHRFLAGETLANVPQSELGKGTLYLTKQWTADQALRAVANFYLRYGPRALSAAPPRLVG